MTSRRPRPLAGGHDRETLVVAPGPREVATPCAPERTVRWLIRHGCGCVRELSSLTHLAELIYKDRLDLGVEISAGDDHWRRLDDIVDREAFCSTFKALGYLPRGSHCASSVRRLELGG